MLEKRHIVVNLNRKGNETVRMQRKQFKTGIDQKKNNLFYVM